MTTDVNRTNSAKRRSWALSSGSPGILFVLLAAPMAWSAQLLVSYFFVSFHLGLSHTGVRFLILAAAAVAAAVALTAALIGAFSDRRGEDGGVLLDDNVSVRGFVGQAGILLGCLFGLGIVALTVPVFMERL